MNVTAVELLELIADLQEFDIFSQEVSVEEEFGEKYYYLSFSGEYFTVNGKEYDPDDLILVFGESKPSNVFGGEYLSYRQMRQLANDLKEEKAKEKTAESKMSKLISTLSNDEIKALRNLIDE